MLTDSRAVRDVLAPSRHARAAPCAAGATGMRRLPSLLAAATLGATVLTAAAGSAAAGPGFAPHTDTFGGNWAGYAASGQTFTSITGSWTEPQATCTARHDLYAPG